MTQTGPWGLTQHSGRGAQGRRDLTDPGARAQKPAPDLTGPGAPSGPGFDIPPNYGLAWYSLQARHSTERLKSHAGQAQDGHACTGSSRVRRERRLSNRRLSRSTALKQTTTAAVAHGSHLLADARSLVFVLVQALGCIRDMLVRRRTHRHATPHWSISSSPAYAMRPPTPVRR